VPDVDMNILHGGSLLPGWRVRMALRIILLAVALLYLAFMRASHTTPFDQGLQAPLAIGGWALAAAVMATVWWHGRGYSRRFLKTLKPWKVLRGRRGLMAYCAVMAGVLGIAAVVGLSGMSSTTCQNTATTCLKIDKWSEADGNYYRQYPYDSQGNDDPTAPWVQISRSVYVAEVGSQLRSAALFGVLSLAGGTALTVIEEGVALALLTKRREIGDLGMLAAEAGLGL
jgi:hypothetical protein